VVVNRVFGPETGTYFGAWRDRQQEQLAAVRDAFSPVPVLQAPYFDEEVVGAEMLDRLGGELFAAHDPQAHLHDSVSQRLEVGTEQATLRLDLPFAQRADLSLKRVGSELIVRVDGHQRTMLLPPALDAFAPRGAAFADGTLTITFDREPTGAADGVPA
jgi:arsenite-transporting ATPase